MSQLGNGFGITIQSSEKLYETIISFIEHLPETNWIAVSTFFTGIAFLFGAKKRLPRIPGVIILTVLGIGL